MRAKLTVIHVIGANPIRVNQQTLNDAIEIPDFGRQLGDTSHVFRWIGHSAVVDPSLSADPLWVLAWVHRRSLTRMIAAVSRIALP
jgi:hypothetical protein